MVPRQGDGQSSPTSSNAGLTLDAAQRARDKTLVDFFHAHNVRYDTAVDRRLAAIRGERPLTTDAAVIGPARLLVEVLVPQLRAVTNAVRRFDEEIERLCGELIDYKLFRALPGAGPVFAARLLAAFGEQRERFPTASALQTLRRRGPGDRAQRQQELGPLALGLPHVPAPDVRRMGRQTVPHSFWARAFYESHRAKGASHNAAIRALAFKWIRILFRCWVDRTPYNESRYLAALQKRSLPLLKFAAETAFIIRLRSASGRGLASVADELSTGEAEAGFASRVAARSNCTREVGWNSRLRDPSD